MTVVSNTTPILSLYKIGNLSLLQSLFGQVTVPRAVYNEIAILGSGKQGSDAVEMAGYICVHDVHNKLAANLLRSQLDYGEAEAIVLDEELGADLLILDEKKACKIAQINSMPVIGTIGILQTAKEKRLITNMKTQLDKLIASDIWIDRVLYQAVLRNNNEA